MLIRNVQEIEQRDDGGQDCDNTIIQSPREYQIGECDENVRGYERDNRYEGKGYRNTDVPVALHLYVGVW